MSPVSESEASIHVATHDSEPRESSSSPHSRQGQEPQPEQKAKSQSELQPKLPPELPPKPQPNPSRLPESDSGRPSSTSTDRPRSPYVPEIVVKKPVYEKMVRELSSTQEDLRKAREEIYRLTKELGNERSRLSVMAQDLQTSVELAECRRQELKVFENYLTTKDRAAASDVKSCVERLNSIIYHESANMIGGFRRRNLRAPYEDVRQNLCISSLLVDVLQSHLGEDESFLIRTALQATLVVYVEKTVSAWNFTSQPVHQEFAKTYHSIHQSGELASSFRGPRS
jgi:hypothetical protein